MQLKRWIYKNNESSKLSEGFMESLFDAKNINKEDRASFISPVFNREKCVLRYEESIEAGKIVKEWMSEGKKILIFGDYDVDGTCATAILKKTFSHLNYENVSFHIPSRFHEGYGLNEKSIELMLRQNPDAVITVDCGINANDSVQVLKDLGINVLITDHHSLPEVLPSADYILDPKLTSEEMPFYDLCGAGVAFYLALNLVEEGFDYKEILQLAALATVADLVPLTRDNRLIVASGLEEMRKNPSLSLRALFEANSVDIKQISAGKLAFQIAPSINAAGRLKHAYEALKLLISEDEEMAKEQAQILANLNVIRKDNQERVIVEAMAKIDEDASLKDDGIIMVYSEDWHEGVIGIAASRLVEEYHRPAIVFSLKDGVLKGSARSIGDFSIYKAIDSGRDYLNSFGGHNAACGLNLELSKFPDFKERIKEYCLENLREEDLEARQKIDMELNASDITFESLGVVNSFEPYGIGNPTPVFSLKDMRVDSSFLIGKNKDHLKLKVKKEDSVFDGIKFSLKEPKSLEQDYRVDIAFNLKENRYKTRLDLQFMLKNIRLYDPSIKGVPAYAFALYAKEFVKRVNTSKGLFPFDDYSKLDSVKDRDLMGAIEGGNKIIINNFESYLSAIYSIYDSGVHLSKALDEEYLNSIIEILPQNPSDKSLLHGHSAICSSISGRLNEKYRQYIMNQLVYNRAYFQKMYAHLQRVQEVDTIKFIYSSLYPLTTALGLEFFREAGFIREDGKKMLFYQGEHRKYEYEKSDIRLGIDNIYSIL